MATNLEPIVGNWYQNLDDDAIFEVVAFDEDEGLVEIQHEDGDIDQVDLEEWDLWELESITEPDDWTKPLEKEIGDENPLDPDDDTDPEMWAKPARQATGKRSRQPRDAGEEEYSDWDDDSGDG